MDLNIMPSGLEWQSPTFVIITWRDGTIEERPFATRVQAKAFIDSIPYMQVNFPDDEFVDIAKATLRTAAVSVN